MKFKFGEEFDLFIGDVYCRYFFFDINKPIVITFAPGGVGLLDQKMIEVGRRPWGFGYIKKLGYNVMSFAELKGTNKYYRDPEFYNCINAISNSIPDFPERIGYGGSMGGYGVTAYSNSLGISRLLVFNPISTRNKNIATWDFEAGRSLWSFNNNWNDFCYDGAKTQSSGFIVYDPLYSLDKLHAVRYEKLVHLKCLT